MARDLCNVAMTCRLTKDPELRHTGGGTAVCSLRVAYSTAKKTDAGWEDKSNYIDVTVFGNQAETCAQYLSRGRQIAVAGRLEFSEWESKDGSGKRSKHEIVAESIVFIGPRDGEGGSGSGGGDSFVPASQADDDIPF